MFGDTPPARNKASGISLVFNLGSAKVCLPVIVETYFFSCDKDIWIAITDYYIYFYLILLFLLVVVLQLINFTAS